MATITNTRHAHITRLRPQNMRRLHITTGKPHTTTSKASTTRRKCMPARRSRTVRMRTVTARRHISTHKSSQPSVAPPRHSCRGRVDIVELDRIYSAHRP